MPRTVRPTTHRKHPTLILRKTSTASQYGSSPKGAMKGRKVGG
jgi:hypothetical protein